MDEKRHQFDSEYFTKEEIDASAYQRRSLLPSSELQRRILQTYRLSDAFRRSYGEYLFSDNPDRKSIQSAVRSIKRFRHVDTVDMDACHELIVDMLYSKYVLGYTYLEYFMFDFEHTPICDRLEFLSETKRDHYYAKLNNSKQHNVILDNKYRAYQLLKPFYRRDVIQVLGKDDFDAFSAFVKAHPRFILKPFADYGGHSVRWIDSGSSLTTRSLFDSLLKSTKKFLCEEPIIAPDYMKRLYPNAVNTVRVLTYFNGEDEPVVLSAILRVGQNGNGVDNFSSGGIIAFIDIQTGVITSGGVDRDNNRFAAHPNTGVPFEGFQIQDWEGLLSTARQLPRLLPQVRLIGWDLAASADKGWQVIEGNVKPWIEIHQFCRPEGFRRMIEEKTEWARYGI